MGHNYRPVVLAVGGLGLNSAEVLDYTNENANAWEEIASVPGTEDLGGARALPSLSGNGAYLQFDKNLYELICTSTGCIWKKIKTSKNYTNFAVMMYLPRNYEC